MKTSLLNQYTAALVALAWSNLIAPAQIYSYIPALGTLPEAQGFSRIQNVPFPEPTVSDGIFHEYPGTNGGYQQWYRSDAVLDFSTNSYVIEAVVRVLYAKDADPGRAFGYGFGAIDSAGRQIYLTISTNAVALYGRPPVLFDASTDFHAYRLEVAANGATLFIDGTQYDSVTAAGCACTPNSVSFGDGGSDGECEVELRQFRFGLKSPPLFPAAYSYDASLGTFPDFQGFSRYETGAPPAVVTNGALHQYANTNIFLPLGYQFWYTNGTPLDFSTTPYVLDVALNVISADYRYNPHPEQNYTNEGSGYQIGISDASARAFRIGFSDGLIQIHTDVIDSVFNGAHIFTTTTDGFHGYRLVVSSGIGRLFIDDSMSPAAQIPIGNTGAASTPNSVFFGDGQHAGVSETELRYLRFTSLLPPRLSSQPLLLDPGHMRLRWESAPGYSYQVQYSHDLSTNGWTNFGTQIQGDGTTKHMDDAIDMSQRFYRLSVFSPPLQ